MFEQLDYIREEGRFKWNDNGAYKTNIGKYAGSIQRKRGREYRQLCIKKKYYNEGRVVWYMEHGIIPGRIFHKDGNTLNNEISNLTITVEDRIRPEGIVCLHCNTLKDINLYLKSCIKRNRYICKECEVEIRISKAATRREQRRKIYELHKDKILEKNKELRNIRAQYEHAMRQLESE